MKLPKCLDKFVKVAALGSALLFNSAVANSDIYLFGDVGVDLNIESPIAQVQTVPGYIRNVPAHSGDSSLSIAPIKDSSVILSPFALGLEGRLGVGFKKDELDFKIGPKAGVALTGNLLWPIERNYTNAPDTDRRGYGAALTFYNLENDEVNFVPGIFTRFSFPFNPEITGFIEYSADFLHRLYVINGWDRYDRFEEKDRYKLADFMTHTLKFGIKKKLLGDWSYGGVEGFVALKIPQLIQGTSLADETNLKFLPSVLVGCRIDLGITTE